MKRKPIPLPLLVSFLMTTDFTLPESGGQKPEPDAGPALAPEQMGSVISIDFRRPDRGRRHLPGNGARSRNADPA